MKRRICVSGRLAGGAGVNSGKRLKQIIGAGILCLLFGAGALSVSAAVKEGKPGETLSGDYAVIVNTSTTDMQSTGTLVFDTSGNGVSAARASVVKDSVGQDVQTGESYPVARIVSEGTYSVGTEKSISSPYNGMRTYVCIGENEYCYVWMEKALKEGYDKQDKTDKIAGDMMQTYGGRPYELLKDLAGGSLPWSKLSIMLETISNASGVYKYNSELTAIHINTPEAASYEYGSMGSRNGLLVHEGQHALFRLMAESDTTQPYTWLNEGISVAVMDYLWGGTDNNGWMDSIAGNADIRNGSPLFYKNYRNSTAQDYGMPYLFVRYLIAQAAGGYKPMQLFPNFYKVSAACRPDTYLERVLAQTGHSVSFGDLLTQFYTAILAQESSGVYGFEGDSIVRQKVNNYPLYMGESGQAHSLAPTAAIMVRLENGAFTVPGDGGSSIRYMVVSGGRNVPVPEGGDGSRENPYEISDFNDLALIGNKPGAYYKLTQDIAANGQMNLTPTYFSGVLDGNGHRICGLTRPLIGKNSGTIQNLTVEAAFADELTGTQGVFAQVNSGLIKDCTAMGTVNVRMLRGQTSYMYPVFGVFAGENEVAGTIRGCTNRVRLTLRLPAMQSWTGGIDGIQTGIVKSCSSRGEIHVVQENGDCDVYVGGIAGKLSSMGMGGVMNSCIHTGVIEATGGLPVTGQLCALADSSVVNKGLGNCIVSCHAKQGSIPAIGSPQGVLSEDGILLTEDQIGKQESYGSWDFDSEWKMGDDGPERLGSSDIQELGATNTPTECYVGEQIYRWGSLTINGRTGAEITQDMVSGFDSSTAGVKTVQVSYLGKTTTFAVNVKKPGKITSFVLPDSVLERVKKTYSAGQYFDPSGLYFIATIDGNGNHLIYSGYDYERKPLTENDKSVIISYFDASAEIPVTVEGKKPMSLTVASRPSKMLYGEGQNLDLSGLRVSITYNNGDVTPLFGADEFGRYGIRVAKKAGSIYTAIAADQVLTSADDGAAIYICATENMPNNSEAVAKSVATLTVKPRLQVEKTVLYVVRGVQINSSSILVSGGSGNYTVEKLHENLPSGISVQWWISSFLYDGTAMDPEGSYVSQYRIKDTETGQTITPEITVQVHLSDYVELYMFNIPLAWNRDVGLTRDVIGIIDNTNDMVVLRVPDGTDVSALKINVDYGAGIGVTVPMGYTAMSELDFGQPIIYELTAPDGKTKRRYTVIVEFYDSEGEDSGSDTGNGGDTAGGGSNGAGGGGDSGAGGSTGGGTAGGGTGSSAGDSGSGAGESVGGGTAGGTGSGGDGGSGSGAGESTGGAGSSTGSYGETVAGSPNPGNTGGTDLGSGKNQTQGSSPGQGGTVDYPLVGTLIKSGGLCYRITASSPTACTAELYRPVKKKKAAFKAAATVKAGGHTYKVTSIAAGAFRNNRYLKRITIGKYVVSIGNQAFYGCRNLKLIKVRSAVLKQVKNAAIKGIHQKAVIRVPKKKRAAYKKLFKREVS